MLVNFSLSFTNQNQFGKNKSFHEYLHTHTHTHTHTRTHTHYRTAIAAFYQNASPYICQTELSVSKLVGTLSPINHRGSYLG